MKILHTSDWHLGHTLYGYDRTEEQTSMIEQIVSIVEKQKPDLFLLCGDVYHTPQPSSAVQTMFTDAIVKIHDANPNMTMVITAGNHDSGSKHEIFKTPWQSLKVYTIGNLDKDKTENLIIEIPNKAYVIAIPYAHERNIPEEFFQSIIDKVTSQNSKNLPIIMSAHTTVRGCDFIGHDNSSEYSVGGIDSFEIEQLGKGYDYLALGHIHHAQFIHTGNHNVRYSGTPLAINFDETFNHSISIINISQHGEKPDICEIEINNPHPLVTLPSSGFASWEEAKTLLHNFPNEIEAYIRLNIEIDDFLPSDANAEAIAITENKKCKFCYINAHRKNTSKTDTKVFTVQELKKENPIHIVKRYANDMGIEFDNVLEQLFKEALRQEEEDSRNN